MVIREVYSARHPIGKSPPSRRGGSEAGGRRGLGMNASSRMERHVWRTKDGISLQLVFPDVRGGSRVTSNHTDALDKVILVEAMLAERPLPPAE